MKYPKEYLEEIKLRLKVSHVVGKQVKLRVYRKILKLYFGQKPDLVILMSSMRSVSGT